MPHTTEEVQELNGIKVGDYVIYTPESGFHAGKPHRRKVARIVTCTWDWESARKMGIPSFEWVYVFEGGETAGYYDRVRKDI